MVEVRARAPRRFVKGQITIDIAIAFAFGVAFLCIMLTFAVFFPNPEPFQARVFITTLALAAGGVGAMLPGSIEVRFKGVLRAGGALALMALVYSQEPAITRSAVTLIEPSADAKPLALSFVADIDSGDVTGSWAEMDQEVIGKSPADFENWKTIYENFRKPLGAVDSRVLVGTNRAESPQGYPVGLYQSYLFRTRFHVDTQCRSEQVVLRATQNKTWTVTSYQISPTTIPCQ
ncbi:DUF4019 domain-containing protein [Mesorhizobium neociceri]|uniref:DUF4019 domain-containing protein n=1 Tax=Mesorhizobium neociceri TaxID=1307853 RepID=A0A838BAT3_9HYPH|nr:DUF4019 domain-containing protein [Mesorhizobium neociceri]MBA1142744.1 DUF4019 domain-containing protein [Mesorhizobium neociceri]